MNDGTPLHHTAFPISCLEFDTHGLLYLADVHGTVCRYGGGGGGGESACFQPHTKGINDMYVSGEHDFIVTASDDHSVAVSHKQDLKTRCTHSEHHAPVTCVTSAPCIFPIVISGGYDENLVVFNADTEQVVHTLPAHADPVTGVALSQDGRLLASCSYDGLVRVWDARSGRVLKSMIGDTNPAATGVLFSADGQTVLASYLDSSVKQWDVRTGTLVKVCAEHANSKYIIRPKWVDASTVAMGSEDGKVYLYGEAVRALQLLPADDPCLNVAVGRDAVLAGTGLKGGVVKFIKL